MHFKENTQRLAFFTTTAFLILTINSLAWAQTIIAQQDFETTPATPVWTFSNTGGTVSTNTGAGDTPANSRIRNGARSYQVNNETGTLNFSNVTIPTGYSSVKITVHISSTSVTSGNGADAADNVRIFTALNGAAFPATADITVNGNLNSRYDYNDTDGADVTVAGTPITVVTAAGTNNSPKRSILQVNIPNGTTSVALRVIAVNNDVNEVWNIDDVILDGVAPSAASAAVGGRVTLPNGRGIFRARVTMTDSQGDVRTAFTNQQGFFSFTDVPGGETYIFTASHRRYQFAVPSLIQFVGEDSSGINFVASGGNEFFSPVLP